MTRSLLLDTTVFSAILRREPHVYARFAEELAANSTILVSPVVYYELRRGLLKRNAQRLLLHLDRLIAQLLWLELTRSDWEAAATLWARTQLAGRPHGDADILIAAQANNRRATVVTDNVRDFQDVADELESW